MTYVLPMLLMAVCYTRMGRHLWGSEIVGEETPALLKNYQNKKKVRGNTLLPGEKGLGFIRSRGPYFDFFLRVGHDLSGSERLVGDRAHGKFSRETEIPEFPGSAYKTGWNGVLFRPIPKKPG